MSAPLVDIYYRVSTDSQEDNSSLDVHEAVGAKWSTVICYFPSCNSMPNISASSSVILIR